MADLNQLRALDPQPAQPAPPALPAQPAQPVVVGSGRHPGGNATQWAKIRIALYLLTGLLTPVMTYLNAEGILNPAALQLWSAEVTAATAVAGLNVFKKLGVPTL